MEDFIFLLKKIKGNKEVVPRHSERASAMVIIDWGAGYMNVFNLWKFSELYTYDLWSFMYMLYLNKILQNVN